jgi:NAD(P)-dependent dehydrogenase (short-subunit alcohol dehydrogenase family)
LRLSAAGLEIDEGSLRVRLKGKKAIVTGSGRGIGRGIAEVFAEEGAEVAVVDVSANGQAEEVAEWVRRKGQKSVAIHADVSNRAQVESMVEKAWSELGPIDILVNNAGIETIVPFLEMTDDQWTRVVDVNLRGPWMCSQVFCRKVLGAKRKGAIVNIGSVQAARSLPGRTHYAPTKLAIEALTRNISTEVAHFGIRVNAVHPGLFDTPMTEWVMKDKTLLPQVLSGISLGRAGQPREAGAVVAFFASDDASYLTGQSIHLEGGWIGK